MVWTTTLGQTRALQPVSQIQVTQSVSGTFPSLHCQLLVCQLHPANFPLSGIHNWCKIGSHLQIYAQSTLILHAGSSQCLAWKQH